MIEYMLSLCKGLGLIQTMKEKEILRFFSINIERFLMLELTTSATLTLVLAIGLSETDIFDIQSFFI